jgi:hypothetical protein
MPLPDRVSVPTCIGCGAMSRFGTCDQGCSEKRLELVRATDYDMLSALASDARVRADAYRSVADDLVSGRPGPQGYEAAYRRLQKSARSAVRRFTPIAERDPDRAAQDEDAERATAWWCARCGGIDAPRPCLGICVWRRIDWVNANVYDQQRGLSLATRETELCLHRLVRCVASITPRAGHWQRGWTVLQIEARSALAQCANDPRAHAASPFGLPDDRAPGRRQRPPDPSSVSGRTVPA